MKFLKKCVFFLIIFLLIFSNYVFAANNNEPFTGMEDYAWNVLISLDEYKNGDCNILVTKYYDDYKVFFITKQTGLTFTFSKDNSRTSKYDILNENQRITFNVPVTFTQYNIDSNGVASKTYSNQIENEYITFNPYDHGYSNSDILNSDGTVFFPIPVQEVVVIPVLEGVEELPKAVTTTLKMILPVGLVVFGILLLVYIIRLLILRVT